MAKDVTKDPVCGGKAAHNESMPRRTCTVSFGNWTHVTMASSLFEACRTAWEWFNDPFWQGPHPTPDTIFTVRVVGQDKLATVYRVRGRSFLRSIAPLEKG